MLCGPAVVTRTGPENFGVERRRGRPNLPKFAAGSVDSGAACDQRGMLNPPETLIT